MYYRIAAGIRQPPIRLKIKKAQKKNGESPVWIKARAVCRPLWRDVDIIVGQRIEEHDAQAFGPDMDG